MFKLLCDLQGCFLGGKIVEIKTEYGNINISIIDIIY